MMTRTVRSRLFSFCLWVVVQLVLPAGSRVEESRTTTLALVGTVSRE
jgi:hypothetical protein